MKKLLLLLLVPMVSLGQNSIEDNIDHFKELVTKRAYGGSPKSFFKGYWIDTSGVLRLAETTAEGLLEMVKMGFAIDGLSDALETLQNRFEEPECSSLLTTAGLGSGSSANISTTSILTDNEGVYTSITS